MDSGSLTKAEELMSRGEYAQAILLFQDILNEHPQDFRVLYGMAETLHRVGKYPEALKNAIAAYEINPDGPGIHLTLGLIYNDLKRYKEAEVELIAAETLNPEDLNASGNLGFALIEQYKVIEAIPVLQKVVAAQPDNWCFHYNLSLAYLKNRQFIAGLQEAWAAIKLQPSPGAMARVLNNIETAYRPITLGLTLTALVLPVPYNFLGPVVVICINILIILGLLTVKEWDTATKRALRVIVIFLVTMFLYYIRFASVKSLD